MPSSNNPILKLTDVSAHYGPVQAIHQVSLEVNEGELVSIVGANGAGKTTLLHTISATHRASAGQVALNGSDLSCAPAHTIVEQGICHVPEGRQVFAPLSVEDNLNLGAYLHRGDPESVAAQIEEIYQLFPILKEKSQQMAGTLSGGQQQMLAIGRALLGRPKLLLLDEPSMGLAPLLVEEIFSIIKELNDKGVTILLVEQNARAALGIADRGYVMETGRIVLEDSADALLVNEQVQKAYLGH